ncbi:hypothetical protein C2845_PM13G16230 [Panicum miliaceum]|uniref:Uncharacterized protein n=1 Tax=Panicum miliaceum TaxID=4540 RepID=A0A3L6RHQ2_PANMI|nr:hypothetical protein C2845_PM13G16230 [Panicum miliaceum]
MPAMPEQAMELLSRTWNPASSDLFQILSPACSTQLGSSAPEDRLQPADHEVTEGEPEDEHLDAARPMAGIGQLFDDETWDGTVVARGTPRSTVRRRNKLLPQQPAWVRMHAL